MLLQPQAPLSVLQSRHHPSNLRASYPQASHPAPAPNQPSTPSRNPTRTAAMIMRGLLAGCEGSSPRCQRGAFRGPASPSAARARRVDAEEGGPGADHDGGPAQQQQREVPQPAEEAHVAPEDTRVEEAREHKRHDVGGDRADEGHHDREVRDHRRCQRRQDHEQEPSEAALPEGALLQGLPGVVGGVVAVGLGRLEHLQEPRLLHDLKHGVHGDGVCEEEGDGQAELDEQRVGVVRQHHRDDRGHLVAVARVPKGPEDDVGGRHNDHRQDPHEGKPIWPLHGVLDGEGEADALEGVDGHADKDGQRRRDEHLDVGAVPEERPGVQRDRQQAPEDQEH
mmetsp:Transcript_531/g.1176  ORF Transcript_531/g.1176 Transcript_531/m.1176 type:complete len:338 (-) Transcript_531:1307-2320(-)